MVEERVQQLRRQHKSLPLRLLSLETEGRLAGPPFAAVPPSGLTPIEHVLDEAGELKSVVLLGFTRDGSHLISYTTQPVAAAEGQEGYSLQLWRLLPGERCRRLWSVPLFRCQPYLDSLAEEEEFMLADDLCITVAEAPDGGLLVVHGRSADPADASSRDQQLANHLSVLPGPAHAGAAQLQVAHLSYNTTYPHTLFNPYHLLTPLPSTAGQQAAQQPDARGGGGPGMAIALYAGDGTRYVHAAVGRQPLAPPLLPPAGAASPRPTPAHSEDEEDSSTSMFASPDLARQGSPPPGLAAQRAAAPLGSESPRWRQQQASNGGWPASRRASASPRGSPWPQQRRREQRQAAAQRGSPAGECGRLEVRHTLVSCAHAGPPSGWPASDSSTGGLAAVSLTAASQRMDLEGCLYAALRQQGLPPSALLDYAAAPVLGCSWGQRDGLLLLAVLRLARQHAPPLQPEQQGQQQGRRPEDGPPQPQPQPQPQHRSACVLLHAAAASGEGAVVEWLEPPYPWHHDLSAFLVQQTAFAGLAFDKAPAFFAEFMRSRYGLPPPRAALPLVLTNRSVLSSGQSLRHVAHPWLPIAILGYRGGAAT